MCTGPSVCVRARACWCVYTHSRCVCACPWCVRARRYVRTHVSSGRALCAVCTGVHVYSPCVSGDTAHEARLLKSPTPPCRLLAVPGTEPIGPSMHTSYTARPATHMWEPGKPRQGLVPKAPAETRFTDLSELQFFEREGGKTQAGRKGPCLALDLGQRAECREGSSRRWSHSRGRAVGVRNAQNAGVPRQDSAGAPRPRTRALRGAFRKR